MPLRDVTVIEDISLYFNWIVHCEDKVNHWSIPREWRRRLRLNMAIIITTLLEYTRSISKGKLRNVSYQRQSDIVYIHRRKLSQDDFVVTLRQIHLKAIIFNREKLNKPQWRAFNYDRILLQYKTRDTTSTA